MEILARDVHRSPATGAGQVLVGGWFLDPEAVPAQTLDLD
jgi:hypothetical protein